MDKNRRDKIKSKYFRLELSDDLKKVMEVLVEGGIEDLVETQVGNHIYSGQGKLEINGEMASVNVRVWMMNERPLLVITAPGKNLKVVSPLDPDEAYGRLRKAREKLLN